MSAANIATLLQSAKSWGIALDTRQVDQLRAYLDMVLNRNQTVNLTADATQERMLLCHAADGLFAAAALRKALPNQNRPRICDLGAGAGFIGISIKIAWPESDMTLIESARRKFLFLNSASARIGTPGLRALCCRVETGMRRSSYLNDFDVVIERALAPLPEAARCASTILKAGGLFAAFQSNLPSADDLALCESDKSDLRLLESLRYRRPIEAKDRFLLLFSKLQEDDHANA